MHFFPLYHRHCTFALFWGLGGLLVLASVVLLYQSQLFSYDYLVKDMPISGLVVGLMVAGLLFLALRFVVGLLAQKREERQEQGKECRQRRSLLFVLSLFSIGLVARLLMMVSDPVLEDDFQRYLWDGGLVAHGVSPYHHSPENVLDGRAPQLHLDLANRAFPLLERVNHPELRTIYPVGAEVFFALAHEISPFSLFGWRAVLLLSELITFSLLLTLVRHVGRDEIWLVLYWWNPLVIKELMNSGHMEGVLMPFLALGMFAAITGRLFLSSGVLALAASIKIWPALLLPLIWRRMFGRWWALTGAIVFALVVGGAIVWPFISSGLDQSSGLVAYAQKWATNSALFPMIEKSFGSLVSLLNGDASLIPYLARGAVGLFLLLSLLRLVTFSKTKDNQLLVHLFFMTLMIFLLSPAQFPWYFLWVSPFLIFYPLWGLTLLVPLMALYYVGFSLLVDGTYDSTQPWLVWLIWLPVLIVLFVEGWQGWLSSQEKKRLHAQ